MDHKHIKKTSIQLNEREKEYFEDHFLTNQVYKGLGMTRDALRYYEQLGFLNPLKNEDNNYREYSIDDIWKVIAIDFYKKRGVTPKELKKVRESNEVEEYKKMFLKKQEQIKADIEYQTRVLEKLEQTIEFYESMERELNVFKIKELLLYEVEEEISSIINFKEYKEKILDHMDVLEEDIFTKMVRVLHFNDHGYTGSTGYIVRKSDCKISGKRYLLAGKALCVLIEDFEEDGENLMEKMFVQCMAWAKENNKIFKGVVYLIPVHIYFTGESVRNYLECWVPLEK